MKLSLASSALLLLAICSQTRSVFAGGTCQTAQPLTTGTQTVQLHDYFIHPDNWDTTYEWYRVTLQPGEQFAAYVSDIVIQFGSIGFTYFELWEADPVNCTGALLQDVSPLYGSNGVLNTVNHTGAPKDYVVQLAMLSAAGDTSLELHCDLHALIAPEPCAGVPDDAFEPNQVDSARYATPGTYPNLFAKSTNDDWYQVVVTSGATLTAHIAFMNAAGDLDLDVGSTSSNSTNDGETASWTNTYTVNIPVIVHVHAKAGLLDVCNHYDLTLSIVNPAIGTSYCVGAHNSTGFGGFLFAAGPISVGANALTFIASGLPSMAPSLLYDGTTQVQAPFGDGLRCVGGSTHRIQTRAASAVGTVTYPIDFTALQPSAVITPGSTWNFQAYYRNLNGPGHTGFNLTNGLSITFLP